MNSGKIGRGDGCFLKVAFDFREITECEGPRGFPQCQRLSLCQGDSLEPSSGWLHFFVPGMSMQPWRWKMASAAVTTRLTAEAGDISLPKKASRAFRAARCILSVSVVLSVYSKTRIFINASFARIQRRLTAVKLQEAERRAGSMAGCTARVY